MWLHVRIEMNSSRSLLLLVGLVLFGTIASHNVAGAQASFLDSSSETARASSKSAQQSAAPYQPVTDEFRDATTQEQPAPVVDWNGRQGEEALSQPTGARSNAEPSAPVGNPLWELPVKRLLVTRERPIFLPSRRPPTPPAYVARVTVRPQAKPPEPEAPSVSLIGTIIGTDVQIGIFLDKATHNVVRLRLGEEHQGWVLRLIKAREVTLVKGVAQTLMLGPSSGGAPAASGPIAPALVPNSIGTIPVVNTAEYVDEQPLPARGAQRQRH